MSNLWKLIQVVKQLKPQLVVEVEKKLNQHARSSVNDFIISRRPQNNLNCTSYQNDIIVAGNIYSEDKFHETSKNHAVSSKSYSKQRTLFSSFGKLHHSSLISLDSRVFNPYLCVRTFSSSKEDKDKDDDVDEQALSIFKRFKRAYKKHGKVLIGVHLATSTVWFSSFYAAAAYGVDIIPLLESLGASETLLKPFRSSSLGNVALAYLMYKVATPARYAVTLGGTNLAIRYLKKQGKISVPEDARLKKLYADSKEIVKEKLEKKNLNFRSHRINEYLKAARGKRMKIKK